MGHASVILHRFPLATAHGLRTAPFGALTISIWFLEPAAATFYSSFYSRVYAAAAHTGVFAYRAVRGGLPAATGVRVTREPCHMPWRSDSTRSCNIVSRHTKWWTRA